MSVKNKSRKLSNSTNKKISIVSTLITLILALVIGVVLSYILWNIANDKIIAANSLNTDSADIKFANQTFIINSRDTIDSSDSIKPRDVPLLELGEKLGTLSIPSINLVSPIYVGDSPDVLHKGGCGMDTRMKYPGQNGNVVLAGHTNLVFKILGEAKDGDEVIIDTYYATFTYKIISHEITQYDDPTIIVPKNTEFLTLYTCYPFNFLAPTDKRYVVKCDLVESQDKNEIKKLIPF
ncbi:MAG: class D sortase [Oscillospiraceae bacterium]|nr:class D sortase [Oscillospiraceae bacterium]